MDNLIIANILHRKTRTLGAIAGVALGVVLVVVTVGLVNGFLRDQSRRNSAVTAEILFRPPGGAFGLSISSTLSMPVERARELRQIQGVRDAVPVGQWLRSFRVVDGIEYDSFRQISGIKVVEGRPINSGFEVMVDREYQRKRNLALGDKIKVLEEDFEVVGFYDPESLARIKVPLTTLQTLLNNPDRCSMIFVRVDNPAERAEVAARIKERFPDHGIWLTEQLPILYSRGTPAFQTFLNMVIALAVVISSLVVLLAMYTTVTERTRQIGIMKSLGASRGWIALEIEKEAALISVLGILAGFGLAFVGEYAIQRLTGLNVELELIWFMYALLLGLGSAMLGALYPALRAANQDAVKALVYE
jgi:putative ABC transport system permease protein